MMHSEKETQIIIFHLQLIGPTFWIFVQVYKHLLLDAVLLQNVAGKCLSVTGKPSYSYCIMSHLCFLLPPNWYCLASMSRERHCPKGQWTNSWYHWIIHSFLGELGLRSQRKQWNAHMQLAPPQFVHVSQGFTVAARIPKVWKAMAHLLRLNVQIPSCTTERPLEISSSL